MIVPDKKTETFLNQPVTRQGILSFCWSGLIQPNQFLQAISLCKNEQKWIDLFLWTLKRFVAVSCFSFIALLTLSHWQVFYSQIGFYSLGILFLISSAFLGKNRLADYAGLALIGAMITLPDLMFNTTTFIYQQLAFFGFFAFIWGILTKRIGIKLLFFSLFNLSILFYGLEVLLPSLIISHNTFFFVLSLLNICFLYILQKNAYCSAFFNHTIFRYTALVFSGCSLLWLSYINLWQATELHFCFLDFVLISNLALTFIAGFIFGKIIDNKAVNIAVGFRLIFYTLILGRILSITNFDSDFQISLFLFSIASLFVLYCCPKNTILQEKSECSSFTLRQLLACFNLSIFSPVVQPALKHSIHLYEQKLQTKETFYSIFVLTLSSVILFFAFQEYSFYAGIALLCFGHICIKNNSYFNYRFIFLMQTFRLTGVCLILFTLFSVSKLATIIITFLMMFRACFYIEKRNQRLFWAILFFATTTIGIYLNYPVYTLLAFCLFSLLGVIGILYPFKSFHAQEIFQVFLALPLFVFFALSAYFLYSKQSIFLEKSFFITAFLFTESVITFFAIRKDLDLNERLLFAFYFCLCSALSLLFSTGFMTGILLMFLAFLINLKKLYYIAFALMTGFLGLYFLSLPFSIAIYILGFFCVLFFAIFVYVKNTLNKRISLCDA